MVIYQIKNKINGKLYIGQTISRPKQRWGQHKHKLRKQQYDSHLQNAWNKYGEDAFEFKTIDTASSLIELNKLEDMWIEKFKTRNSKYGYNIKQGGDNKLQAESSKVKLSKTKRPMGWSNIINPDNKEYEVKSLHGFCQEHDLTYSTMYRMMTGKIRYYKGWHLPNTDMTLSRNDYKSLIQRKRKYFPVRSPDGIIYNINNVRKFCREHNLHAGHLRGVMRGEAKIHKGWTKA